MRRFRRPIGDSDFATKFPYLSALLPTGATLAMYLNTAWGEIEATLYGRLGRYPGNLLYPEQLRFALEHATLADIYQAISIGPGTEDDHRAQTFRERATEALDTALSFVREDTDEDKSAESGEYMVVGGGELVR